jgi:CHASE2 domain-containing sensor protein
VKRFLYFAQRIVVSAVLILVGQLLDHCGTFANLEGQFATRMVSGHQEAAAGIATVVVDQKAYASWFGSRSPLEPALVLQIVSALVASGPSAIGVDLLTDDPAYRDSTKLLSNTSIPVVWAADAMPQQLNGVTERIARPVSFWERLAGSHRPLVVRPGPVLGAPVRDAAVRWGVPVFPRAEDGYVRVLTREWIEEPNQLVPYTNTLARAVAEASCEFPCAYNDRPAEAVIRIPEELPKALPLSELFTCATDPAGLCRQLTAVDGMQDKLHGKIVLFGAAFAESRDFYETAVDSRTPGVTLNALAVSNELSESVLHELVGWPAMLIDLAVAAIVFGIFYERADGRPLIRSLRRRIVLCFVAVPLFLFVVSWSLLQRDVLWLTWIGILVFGLAWHLVIEVAVESEHDGDISGARARPSIRRIIVVRRLFIRPPRG